MSLGFVVPKGTKAGSALAACKEQLARDWLAGKIPEKPYDEPLKASRISIKSLNNIFVNVQSYPVAALNAKEQGRVSVLLLISATGQIEQCWIQETAARSLGPATCDAAFKLEAAPATDATRKAIPSKYTLKMTWVLPP